MLQAHYRPQLQIAGEDQTNLIGFGGIEGQGAGLGIVRRIIAQRRHAPHPHALGATSPLMVIALPGSSQGSSALAPGSGPQPTLRVDAGARVTVFVARDLEFPSVEANR